MSARRLGLAVLCAVVGMLAVSGVPAQAAFTHKYLSQLTGFGDADAIAFDAQGDVYVVDRSTKTVDRFSPAGVPSPFSASAPSYLDGSTIIGSPEEGAFLNPGGVAVNDETGDVYVSDGERGVVDVYSATGEFLSRLTGTPSTATVPGPFKYPEALAFDQVDHDLYVGDRGNSVVDVFSATGVYLSQIALGIGNIETISVNELTKEVYVGHTPSSDSEPSVVSIFDSIGGEPLSVWKGASTPPGGFSDEQVFVSVDPTDQHVYVASDGAPPQGLDEFAASSSEEYEGEVMSGPHPSIGAIAVDPVNDDVYVSTRDAVDIFGPDLVVPDVTTGTTPTVTIGIATLVGTVNPDSVALTNCEFEWGTSESLGQVEPCEGSLVTGDTPIEVQASIGLQPDTNYYYRLTASSANGRNEGQIEHIHSPGPGIVHEGSTDVASTSATLDASIEPNSAPTFYYFQYGPTSAYGSEVPVRSEPDPEGDALGSLQGELEVSQHLQDLAAGVTYHCRVVVASEQTPGEYVVFDGADQTFTTQAPGGALVLPDGRAWEMVSPPQKHGAEIERIFEQDVIQASVDGNAMTYVTTTPTESEPQGYSNEVQVLSTRGLGGWSSRDLATPHEAATGHSVGQGFEYRAFSLDLSQALVEPQGPFTQLSPEATERTVYARKTLGCEIATGCYTPLVSDTNVPAGTKYGGDPGLLQGSVQVAGATPDLSHVVLSSGVPLTSVPGDEGGLYEWAAGQLRLISVLPSEEGGKPAPLEELYLGRRNQSIDTISRDGTRIIWSYGAPARHLYMYDHNIDGREETVLLNGGQLGGVVRPEAKVGYQMASGDGSTVFFTDNERLTSNSHATPPETYDLYVCQMVEIAGKLVCDLTDLTPEGNPGESAQVISEGTTASEDGSYVYFVARGALTPGAVAGNPNLYVAHDLAGKWTTTLVSSDAGGSDWSEGKYGQIGGDLPDLTVRVSPDGHYFAFMGSLSLGGYDTRDAVSGQSDEEVYLYDAVSNKLVCASCNPTGARPVGLQARKTGVGGLRLAGGKVWTEGTWIAANIPGWTPFSLGESLYQSRYLSDSGRLFFNSSDALVPQDVNGNEDVYEYEPPGVGGCTSGSASFSERSGGCVDLISSGSSPEESAFMDASENGDNVFFLTSAKLVEQDFDASLDIYDARECSPESPCVPQAPASPPPCTTGDACKAAPSPQPAIYGAPSSQTFSGAGNVVPSTGSVVSPKATRRSRAQMLSKALKACRKKKGHKQDAVCEKRAKRVYGAAFKAKKTSRRGK